MRILCLFFPRLATDLVNGRGARPIVLLDGHGDEAVVTAGNVPRVCRGMLAGQARMHAPHAAFLPDNAGDCLDELQRLGSILRKTATPLVAIGGRDHLFLDLAGVAGGDEATIATQLACVAREWSTTEVRAGVASTRAAALEAARAARNGPIVEAAASAHEPPITWRDPAETFRVTVPGGPGAELRLARTIGHLNALLEGRNEGFRTLRVSLGGAPSLALSCEVRRGGRGVRANPRYSAEEALALIRDHIAADLLESAGTITVELAGLVPDVRTRPARTIAAERPCRPQRVRRLRQPALPLAS